MSAQTASGPTEDQVEILEYNFNKVNKHPDPTTLCLIAAEAGLTEEQTQVRTQAYSILRDWQVPMPPAGLRHRNGLSSAWRSGGGQKACLRNADRSRTREPGP
uniref:Homeodomain-only protein n=1 Tax=Rattus norvegicus TaxID=10116 RepID=A0A8L2QMF2_RAT